MRVFHLISSGGFFGTENVVVNLVEEQLQRGLSVYLGVFKNVYNPHLEITEALGELDFPVHVFNCKNKLDLKTIFEIMNFIKENKIELVHSHGYKANFYTICATLFCEVKKVTTCHNWLSINKKMKFYEWLDTLMLRKFNKVIAVSDSLKEKILNSGVSKDKVLVVNNGIDIKKFEITKNTDYLKKEFNLNSHSKIIGVIARLSQEKGHIYLLEAIKKMDKFTDIKCLIIGDGPMRKDLELKVRSFGLESEVIFTGVRNDVPELLNLIDIFVLPSLKEGMPVALLEAMAAKKPVLTTKVGAIPKIIEDSKTGILVEPKDSDALFNALELLLKNGQIANTLALNGFIRVKEEFSSQKMAEDYIKVYKSL